MTCVVVTWLWLKGYNVEHGMLKIQSAFVDIHVSPTMVPVEGGEFRMGNVEQVEDVQSNPPHLVTIKKFAMGKYEVTFEEYDRYAIAEMKHLPDDQGWGRGRRPVINVSWKDAKDYATWLSEKTGERYRLPTESEWEYAARGGDKQQTWAGTSDGDELASYAVFARNSEGHTAVVGTKLPNSFKLHDLSGNVFEWVEDCADEDYRDMQGAAFIKVDKANCNMRGLRGGSWDNKAADLRAFQRGSSTAKSVSSHLGFRLAQDLEP